MESRRARRQNVRNGSGREATKRTFQFNKRFDTGLAANRRALDEDGFENVDDFWKSEESRISLETSMAESTPGSVGNRSSFFASSADMSTNSNEENDRSTGRSTRSAPRRTPLSAYKNDRASPQRKKQPLQNSSQGKKGKKKPSRKTPTPKPTNKRLSFGSTKMADTSVEEEEGDEEEAGLSDDGGVQDSFQDSPMMDYDDDVVQSESDSSQAESESEEEEELEKPATPIPVPSRGRRGKKAADAKKNKARSDKKKKKKNTKKALPKKKATPVRRKRKSPEPSTTPDSSMVDDHEDEDGGVNEKFQPLPKKHAPAGVRRSTRTRYKPLAHWKGERLKVTAVQQPSGKIDIETEPGREGVSTPTIKRARNAGGASTPFAKRAQDKRKRPGKAAAEKVRAAKKAAAEKKLPPVVLPKGFQEANPLLPIEGVRDDGTKVINNVCVVRRGDKVRFQKLPHSTDDDDAPEAEASGAFERETFLAGVLKLVPGAKKEPETVRDCSQVFFVVHGQERSLQVTINDGSHFILSQGDHFYVPPSCTYELKNHSKHVEAKLGFVVVKPRDVD